MTRVRSFAPIADVNATVLVLGSMPGAASLSAAEYYAHPRNLFWSILGELLEWQPGKPYAARVAGLLASEIALWDVLKSCTRTGSLDADIVSRSIVPNDFPRFFATHSRIERVFFNGSTAERCYRRHVLPLLPAAGLRYERLPSTSPAHAAMSYERKLAAWRAIRPAAGNGERLESRARPRRLPAGIVR